MTLTTPHRPPTSLNAHSVADRHDLPTPRRPRHLVLKRVILGTLLLIPVPFVLALTHVIVHHSAPAGGGG